MPEKADVDLSEFLELSRPRRLRCGMAVTLEKLSPDDRSKLEAALHAEGITHVAISKWLASRGHRVSDNIIGYHRKGACSCGYQ